MLSVNGSPAMNKSADPKLAELAVSLREKTEAREEAQAALTSARDEQAAASQAIRNHLRATYGVDPWRL